jgi:probable HAF family extracellular repeat protein
MSRGVIWVVTCIAACLASTGTPAAQFIPLGITPIEISIGGPIAVSNSGDYLLAIDATKTGFPTARSVIWSDAGGIEPATPDERLFGATAISGNGRVIAGNLRDSAGVSLQAFRFSDDSGTQALMSLSAEYDKNDAWDMSVDGSTIVGGSSGTGVIPKAVVWDDAGHVRALTAPDVRSSAIGVSADGTVIVGTFYDDEHRQRAFRWTELSGVTNLGDGIGFPTDILAADVSNDGNVVVGLMKGVIGRPGGSQEAFRWTQQSGFEVLGHLGNERITAARSISGDGTYIVGESGVELDARAFVWDAVHGMRELQEVLQYEIGLGNAMAGWKLTHANSVSRDGLAIVGNGVNPAGDLEGWLVRLDHPIGVPEPSSFVLLLLVAFLATPPLRLR